MKRLLQSQLGKFGMVGLVFTGLMLASPNPAQAMAFRQVAANQGRGANGAAVPTLDVSATWGLTISFLKTNELIQQVRVGDPSRLVVDFDAPLASGGAGAASSVGSNTGATIIYLRQLSEPLDLDLRLTKAARNTKQVPLTVLTVDNAGSRKMYQFRLLLDRDTDYSTVEIVPDAMMPQRAPIVPPAKTPAKTLPQTIPAGTKASATTPNVAQQFAQAVDRAKQNQLILPGSALEEKLKQMLGLLNQGKTLEAAASEAGVSMPMVEQFLAL
jgi:hypothetical protein